MGQPEKALIIGPDRTRSLRDELSALGMQSVGTNPITGLAALQQDPSAFAAVVVDGRELHPDSFNPIRILIREVLRLGKRVVVLGAPDAFDLTGIDAVRLNASCSRTQFMKALGRQE